MVLGEVNAKVLAKVRYIRYLTEGKYNTDSGTRRSRISIVIEILVLSNRTIN